MTDVKEITWAFWCNVPVDTLLRDRIGYSLMRSDDLLPMNERRVAVNVAVRDAIASIFGG